mmetsp:Transcript_23855/g.44332  ORF Transcript_23855/g.44332 Transcript_23855/m.44332 type:complete len:131 (+) Transcript_23855:451-843(+)
MDISKESEYLEACPQIFRFLPSMVTETAQFLISEFGVEYLESKPQLLGFKQSDVSYGLEFMSTMMMTDAKSLCAKSTNLLLQAIQGGIQEKAVQNALSTASDATSKASKSIASDTMESYRQLRANNRNKI